MSDGYVNVLIVDDSELATAFLVRLLISANVPLGFVYQGGNGREGLRMMRDNLVDLVFADLNMPEMDGVEMIRRMKADDRLAGLPVIVVTADTNPDVAAELRRLGVTDILYKPIDVDRLRTCVYDSMGYANALKLLATAFGDDIE